LGQGKGQLPPNLSLAPKSLLIAAVCSSKTSKQLYRERCLRVHYNALAGSDPPANISISDISLKTTFWATFLRQKVSVYLHLLLCNAHWRKSRGTGTLMQIVPPQILYKRERSVAFKIRQNPFRPRLCHGPRCGSTRRYLDPLVG